jgi:ABC-type multidrug transport system ATPase subunit
MNPETRNHISVIAPLVVVLGMVLGIYLLDRRWRRLQMRLAKATGVMNESYAFSLNLVRHFMPSFKVEKYQFRGMQQKTGGTTIEFEDLSLKLPSGKLVLEGVTGQFQAGRMCAIMGPSGAGKTTFMNVLCGKATYGQMGGSIRINGQEANMKSLKSVMGFVPQDDIVHQELTVREQIQFSARLRGHVGLSEGRIQRITEDVLNVMQIDHVQNSIVGGVEQRGISGGQRKRVNIGLELAAEPTLLFLDEPTSGLDSTSSLSVCSSLRKMCQLGMTSIMVIHQPRYSLFTLFDDVLLLGKGGKTVYLGPSSEAKPYFEGLGFEMPANENPADWFMDVISGEVPNSKLTNFKPEQLFDLWKQRTGELPSAADRFRAVGASFSRVLSKDA